MTKKRFCIVGKVFFIAKRHTQNKKRVKDYLFHAALSAIFSPSRIAACAAASRAMGMRGPEHET